MSPLQLATTLAAPTGVGLLYLPFEQGGDKAVFVNGSGADRTRISLERVQARPTPAFPGVERMSFKRTVFFTVNAVEYAAITTLITSIPVVMPLEGRTGLFTHSALLARDPVFQAAIENGTLPT